MTPKIIRQIFPKASEALAVALVAAMKRYAITGPRREAYFLAQVGHESANLTRLEENLRYTARGLANTWPNRYRDEDGNATQEAVLLAASGAEAIANNVYADRMGNGDEAGGDGWRFRGRGLLQVTGRENYTRTASALGLPLLEQPELLQEPDAAALSAAEFWHRKGLNELADAGKFEQITKRINGGLNGLEERKRLYTVAAQAIVG